MYIWAGCACFQPALAEMEGVSIGNAAEVARIKYSFTKDKMDKKLVKAYEIIGEI